MNKLVGFESLHDSNFDISELKKKRKKEKKKKNRVRPAYFWPKGSEYT